MTAAFAGAQFHFSLWLMPVFGSISLICDGMREGIFRRTFHVEMSHIQLIKVIIKKVKRR